MQHDSDFYIGYAPPMPARLAAFMRRIVPAACAVALIGTCTIAAGHRLVEAGAFEYGRTRQVTGTIVERPYPALRRAGGMPDLLLVAPGKFGAAGPTAGWHGRAVSVTGTRIARDGHEMLEVTPASVQPIAGAGASTGAVVAADAAGEPATLRGEIVDSKCFLGVMAPGEGRTHRACASLCLRGGIPPALLVRDREGRSRLVLLIGPSGGPIDPAMAAAHAGEPVEMTGRAGQRAGWRILATDAATWRRLR